MASRTHEFITVGSYTRPSLDRCVSLGNETGGFPRYFLFFPLSLSLLTSYHTVRCLSVTKIPLGKDLQTRKSFPICSEMMFDLVSTKRHGQPGLRTDRPGKVHFTISRFPNRLTSRRNNFFPMHALTRVEESALRIFCRGFSFGRDVPNTHEPKHTSRQLDSPSKNKKRFVPSSESVLRFRYVLT